MTADTKLAIVHVAGPWEVEYDGDGKQRRVQRCLRCDDLIARDPDRTGLHPADGIKPGKTVAVTDTTWVTIDRDINPEKEEECVG